MMKFVSLIALSHFYIQLTLAGKILSRTRSFSVNLTLQCSAFPQKLDSNILIFEKANDVIINVYTYEDKNIVPVRVSPLTNDIYLPFLDSTKGLAITGGEVSRSLQNL